MHCYILLKTISRFSLTDCTHPVWLSLGEKSSLAKPPQSTLISSLGEDQSLFPILTLLVNSELSDSSSIHVVPQLQTGTFF